MQGVLRELLNRIGSARKRRAESDLHERKYPNIAHPKVEVGSVLHTMLGLNPSNGAAFADAVVVEIERCITECTIGQASTTSMQAFEQVHRLKNAVASTGSRELIKACEVLGSDVSQGSKQGMGLERRFKAVAVAAIALVKAYRDDISHVGP